MFLEQLDADIQELQDEINDLEEREAVELEKAAELQEQMNIIYQGVDGMRMDKRNKEVRIQSLLGAQMVLRDYDLSTLEPNPDVPEEEEEEPTPDEGRFYPVPEVGAPGNFSGNKSPIGIYNGKNIYAWFIPSSTDYWTKGEQVKFTDGNVYESIIEAANTWTPHSYPQGWKGLGNFDVINGRGDE